MLRPYLLLSCLFSSGNLMGYTIVQASIHHDLKEMAHVVNSAYKKVPYIKDDVERITVDELREIINHPHKYLYLCLNEKEICGTALLDMTHDDIELGMLAVHPDYQGKNIAQIIICHIEQEVLVRYKKEYLYIQVIPFFQEKLVKYYERNGFIFTGDTHLFNQESLERYIKTEYWKDIFFKTLRKKLVE